ncbi:PAS domain S-box protein [Candidatus Latescibacterota bacterium]
MEDQNKTKAKLIEELAALRKQKNELGTSSYNYYQNIIDSSINMIVTVDKHRNIVEFNNAACETFGYTKEEVLGRDVGFLYADQDFGRDIAAQIITKGKFNGEIQNVRKNGELFTSYLSASIILDDMGKSIGTMGSSIDVSTLRNIEKALIESEKRFRSIVESTEAGYFFIDKGGIIRDVNDSWVRLYGYSSKDEIIGEHFTVIQKVDDIEKAKEFVNGIMKGKSDYLTGESSRKCMDGSIGYHTFSARPVKKSGKTIGIEGFIIDTTERKKAQEAFIHEKEEAQRYLDVAKVIFMIHDSEGKVSLINKKGCEVLGYDEQEILGKDWYDNFLPDSVRQKTKDSLTDLMAKHHEPDEYHENFILTKNGEERIIGWYNSFVYDKDGAIERIYCSGEDITERKKAEQALNESEERYRTLVERANDGIMIVQEGEIHFVNTKIFEMYGYTFDEMNGTSFLDYVHPDDRSMVSEIHKKRLKNEDAPETYEIDALTKDGSRIEIEISSGLISYKGKPATLAYLRDITERKQIEIKRSKAGKLESIGILAGGIAHDFNNILAAILGNASLAKMSIDNKDEVIELLTEVEEASLRAKGLTQQLLTFSKGGSPVVKTTELLVLIHDIVQFSLRDSNVHHSIQVVPDLWLVKVDQGQIRQAIGNLIINAQQSMPEGGTINVSAGNVIISSENNLPLIDGEYVKISIEDKGHGISEEHLTKIFDPYFSTKQKGSGLGLATTYSIISQHNGHIQVESETGVGTTFHIYFPAVSAKTGEKQAAAVRSAVMGRRILVMDDDKLVRKYMTKVLEVFGHEVEIAVDGDEMLKIYKKAMNTDNPIDIVIMDLTIPGGMGGKEAIKKLLEIDPDAKAIISSGYSNDPVISNFDEYGFKGFVLKPFIPDDLNKVLNDIIT